MICLWNAIAGTLAVNDDRRSASCDGGEMWCDTAEEQCLTSKRRPGLWGLWSFFFFLSIFFFLVKAGTLYSQRSLLSITPTAFENGGGGCRPGQDFLFLLSHSGTDVSVRRWMKMLPMKADVIGGHWQKQCYESFSFCPTLIPQLCAIIAGPHLCCCYCWIKLVSDSFIARLILLLCAVPPLRCLSLFQNNWMNFCTTVSSAFRNHRWRRLFAWAEMEQTSVISDTLDVALISLCRCTRKMSAF